MTTLPAALDDPEKTEKAFKLLGILMNDERRRVLKDLDPKRFYQHPYWRVVRQHYLYTHPSCEYCRERRATKVVHESFDHWGQEHLHLEDLRSSCNYCHQVDHPDLLVIERDRQKIVMAQKKRSSYKDKGVKRINGGF